MKPILFVLFAALLLAALVYAGSIRREADRDRKPARVVLLVIDTFRSDFLTSYGAPDSLTPHLNRIGSASIQFDQAKAAAPWTLPSVASILTSLYPEFHQMTNDKIEPWKYDRSGQGKVPKLSENIRTMGELFKEAGYETYSSVNNPWIAPAVGILSGFDDYHLAPSRDDREVLSKGLEWFRKSVHTP